MKGYAGKILLVELNASSARSIELTNEEKRAFLGGSSLGAYLFYKFGGLSILPFHTENPLIFTTGPFAGTEVPTSGRYTVVSRSPLTGIWGEGDSGGQMGPKLKSAGYDALIITGKSNVPVYLWVSNDKVEIRNAEHLWGKDTYETTNLITKETNSRAAVACIGIAGENKVLISSIISEGWHGRAVGRCGLGALMGAKNLKGIAVNGYAKVEVAFADQLKGLIRQIIPEITQKTKRLYELGTAGSVLPHAAIGEMSAKNWTLGSWSEAERISGEVLKERFSVTRGYACPRCVIGCGRKTIVPQGKYKGSPAAGPEYESLAGFGGQCLVSDPAVIIEAHDLCNRYGLDVISTSGVIAFAMEAAEKGLLRLPAGSPELTWGNGDAVIFLIDQIAKHQGVGALLGQGVRQAAEVLGGGAEYFAIHVKGLELPYHDPRALSSMAIAYATQPRGACHRGCAYNLERFGLPELGYGQVFERFQVEGKGATVAKMQDYAELFNSLKLCHFTMRALTPSIVVNLLNLVTGENFSLEECLRIGERSINLKRLMNLQWGVTRQHDTLPTRILEEPLQGVESISLKPSLEVMLREYYHARGWTKEGIPTLEKLNGLGLGELWKE